MANLEQQVREENNATRPSDFEVHNHGTISILYPRTPAAEEWAFQNLPSDAQRWGVNGIVIEHRYVQDILFGINNDGLTVGL